VDQRMSNNDLADRGVALISVDDGTAFTEIGVTGAPPKLCLAPPS
jgi:hypothetical protein